MPVTILGRLQAGRQPEDALAQDTPWRTTLARQRRHHGAAAAQGRPGTTEPAVEPPAPRPRLRSGDAVRDPHTEQKSAPRRDDSAYDAAAGRKAPVTTANGNTVTESSGTGSARAVGTIASGSEISLYSGQKVCTNTYNVGDRFTASVAESVQGSNGVSIPAGATAVIEMTSLKRSENANDNIAMEFVVRSIAFNGTTYPVNSTVTSAQVEKVRNGDASNDGKKVATGAIIGAIAGQIFGHHTKSTVIGAATGAAAGAVVAGATGKYDGCVPTVAGSIEAHAANDGAAVGLTANDLKRKGAL